MLRSNFRHNLPRTYAKTFAPRARNFTRHQDRDSGIGRAVAIAFAKGSADVAVVYLEEQEDAQETQRLVEEHRRKCLLIDGDVGDETFCRKGVRKTISELGKIDILVNAAAERHPQDSILFGRIFS